MKRSALFVVMISATLPGCGTEPRLHVVQAGPSGEVSAAELADGLRVVFDRPMVTARLVGSEAKPVPLRIEPAIATTGRWVDRQTLAVALTDPPRHATRYRVRLDPALRSVDGSRLEPWPGIEVVVGRLAVEQVRFEGRSRFLPVDPVAAVSFSEPVLPEVAVRGCGFWPGPDEVGSPVPARLAGEATDPGEAGVPTRTVRLTPSEKLSPDTAWRLRCTPKVVPAEGDAGLGADRDEPLRTYGKLRVRKVTPTGHDVAADHVVVQIELTNPVAPEQIARHVHVQMIDARAGARRPKVEFGAADRDRTRYHWASDLEADTWYRVKIDGDLTDELGQKLGAPEERRFKTGDASPRLDVERGIFAVESRGAPPVIEVHGEDAAASPQHAATPGGRYPVWTRNLHHYTVTCAAVPESRIPAILSGPMNYDAWFGGGEEHVDFDKLKIPVRRHVVKIDHPRNQWHDGGLDLAATCGPASGGLYLLAFDSDEVKHERWERQRASLANLTDLGVLSMVGNASSLVWVVRLSDGKPVPGAAVRILDQKGKLRWSGTTDGDGLADAPGADQLAGVKPRAAHDGGAPDEEYEDWDALRERRVIVTARVGDDLGVLDTNWNNGIQTWNFGVRDDRGGGAVRVRGFLQSDRGLYRPGETVHLRGLVRTIDLTGAMRAPRGKKIHVVIEDPRGSNVVEEDLPVTAYGGFHRDLALPEDAHLGDYTVRGELSGQTFRETFAVEEYRARTFEVKTSVGKPDLRLHEKLRVAIHASYLYGAPVRGGKLTWAVRRRPYHPHFPGMESYTFEDLAAGEGWWRWSRWEEPRSYTWPVADGELELDDKGRATIVTRDPDAKDASEYLLEAQVKDASGQAVPAAERVIAHKAGLYLGLHPEEWVQATDMPFAVQAIAVSPDGKRRAATARLVVTRRDWDCHEPSCVRKDAEVLAREVDIPETGSAVERVVLHDPGAFVVRLEADDGRGGRTVSSDEIYVIGKGQAFWSGDEGDRMGLSASKPSYRAGEVAKLAPHAQLPGATALVALERDGVMKRWVTTLATSGEGIEVPIEAGYAPNVYASVTLVRGRTGEGDRGRPRFKMGLVNLEVDASARRLQVALHTDKPSYRPGETVTAEVKVSGADGQPAVAELAIAAADEGVLQIAGYQTPDPMKQFYEAWGLGVEFATSWNRIVQQHDPRLGDELEEGGDSGGGGDGGRVRSRFLATAFWAPAVVTSHEGVARVTFTAPDNLTAFRLMAVAADAGERFGSGELRFTVRKPLVAMPALPRFFTVGDRARAGVVLHNNTGKAGVARVTASARGVRLEGGAREVKLADGGSQPVLFPIAVEHTGEAVLRFRAQLGDEVDTVEVKLPARRPEIVETISLGEGATDGRAEMTVAIPDGVVPGEGGLELVLDTSGLSALDEGLRYLVGYPYGCLEQTTSKVVPMVALGDLAGSITAAPRGNGAGDGAGDGAGGLRGGDRTRLRGFVETGIAKILRHQKLEGGFGLWPGSPAEPHLAAFALWGLQLAKQGGYRVDPDAVKRGVKYLGDTLHDRRGGRGERWPDALYGDTATRAFALYVLALHGVQDPGEAARLYEQRASLPVYGKAWLARVMHRQDRSIEVETLVAEIAGAAAQPTGPTLLREPEGARLWWYFGTDLRTSAIALSTLLEVAPAHPMVARLADGLLAARQDGRWSNTQENLYALVALADLARARRQAGEAHARVLLDGKTLLSTRLAGAEVRRVQVPLGSINTGNTGHSGHAGRLVIEAGGHTVHYAARLRVARAADEGAAAAHGLALERAYVDPASGVAVEQLKLGQVVKVRLTIRADEAHAHVAVVDHLPAGLEPVLDRFDRKAADDEESVPWWRMDRETRWVHRQLRDDRVELFTDLLGKGDSEVEYLARATTPGRFVAPALTGEAMYQPSIAGRSAAGHLEVTP